MEDDNTTPGSERPDDHAGQEPERRSALRALALGSGAVVAGAAAGTVAAGRGSGWTQLDVAFDVACIGETWREATPNFSEGPSDLRGAPFAVEGWIYPPDTIPTPGDGFIPTPDRAIGRWLCSGFVLIHAERPEPHVQSNQEFVFGPMAPDDLFPDDLLSTRGIEGTIGVEPTNRSVVGGTGRYFGASGVQRQLTNGFNTSQLATGIGPAQNFKMQFQLLLPDV